MHRYSAIALSLLLLAPGPLATVIRQLIFKRTRLTASAGIGPNKLIAKIASDLKLPKDVANYLIQSAASTKDDVAYAVYPDDKKLNYEWTLNSPAATFVKDENSKYPTIHVNTDGVGKTDLTATLVVYAPPC